MDKKDFYYLGKIVKPSGFKGSLMVFFDVDDITPYRDIEAVFVSAGNDLIPYAIHSLQVKSNTSAYVQFEDINSDDEANALVSAELYLPLSFLPPLKGNKFYYHEVTGFEVIDEKSGLVGQLETVIDQGPQGIFVIKNKGKEILLPITDEIIKKVDRKGKRLLVKAPEGLIDLYL